MHLIKRHDKRKIHKQGEAKFAFLVGPYVHNDAQWVQNLYEDVFHFSNRFDNIFCYVFGISSADLIMTKFES